MKQHQVALCVSTEKARAIISPEARAYLDDVTEILLEHQTAVNGPGRGPASSPPAASPRHIGTCRTLGEWSGRRLDHRSAGVGTLGMLSMLDVMCRVD
jgi:hypothetical protein